MRISTFNRSVISLMMLFMTTSLSQAEEVKNNPHSDSGDCAICHVASADKLRSWFVFGSTKRELKDDLNHICQQCHTVQINSSAGLGVGVGHATGKKPSVNHQQLPLAPDGTITCAITCHDMHVLSNDKHQQLKHLRVPANALCISCHDR